VVQPCEEQLKMSNQAHGYQARIMQIENIDNKRTSDVEKML